MNELQMVLLVVAVLAVGGIYWQVRRRSNQQAVWKHPPKEKQISLFDDDGLVGKPRKMGDRSEPTLDDSAPAMPAGILAISIHQRQAQPLPAGELHPALEMAGLSFGEHGYYHKRGVDGRNLYSVGAITKPGTLNPDEADNLSTPGLVFYLELDQLASSAPAVLEDALTTAESLCDRFDAELVDAQRQPLTIEGMEAMREQVRGRALG
nr:cell division protein ZipA C-terminal FtsZ-binding domain-containing protein [Oceanococcus sp. HetDA_MAG_MS8]